MLREFIKEKKIPVLISGAASFLAVPVEMYYGKIKRKFIINR